MSLGKQIVLELYGCSEAILSSPESIEQNMRAAAEVMRATIVTSAFHHFSPLGVSGVVVIQESHLAIHTWPEYEYAAVDIFTCGDIDTEAGIDYLFKTLKATRKEQKYLSRGENVKVCKNRT